MALRASWVHASRSNLSSQRTSRGCARRRSSSVTQHLELADVYAVIAYYLRNTEAMEVYLREAEEAAEKAYAEWQETNPDPDFVKRLQTRHEAMRKERQAS